jgi:hypothetical protein
VANVLWLQIDRKTGRKPKFIDRSVVLFGYNHGRSGSLVALPTGDIQGSLVNVFRWSSGASLGSYHKQHWEKYQVDGYGRDNLRYGV